MNIGFGKQPFSSGRTLLSKVSFPGVVPYLGWQNLNDVLRTTDAEKFDIKWTGEWELKQYGVSKVGVTKKGVTTFEMDGGATVEVTESSPMPPSPKKGKHSI